jgi:hypothetical protein
MVRTRLPRAVITTADPVYLEGIKKVATDPDDLPFTVHTNEQTEFLDSFEARSEITIEGSFVIKGSTEYPTNHHLLPGRDITASHPATAISFSPHGAITQINVQLAVEQVDSNLTTHEGINHTAHGMATWPGTSYITTVGTITVGTWHGSAIADSYIASASAWNALVSFPGFSVTNPSALGVSGSGSSAYASHHDHVHAMPSYSDVGAAAASHTHTVSAISDATTVGQNLVKLTNPSAVTYLRINADNTISTLSASSFVTAIGAAPSGSYLTGVATSSPITGDGTVGNPVGIDMSIVRGQILSAIALLGRV